jgi:hypothetical protein
MKAPAGLSLRDRSHCMTWRCAVTRAATRALRRGVATAVGGSVPIHPARSPRTPNALRTIRSNKQESRSWAGLRRRDPDSSRKHVVQASGLGNRTAANAANEPILVRSNSRAQPIHLARAAATRPLDVHPSGGADNLRCRLIDVDKAGVPRRGLSACSADALPRLIVSAYVRSDSSPKSLTTSTRLRPVGVQLLGHECRRGDLRFGRPDAQSA